MANDEAKEIISKLRLWETDSIHNFLLIHWERERELSPALNYWLSMMTRFTTPAPGLCKVRLGGREPWGGYFRYRMIYFGDEANKELKLISADGEVVGDQPHPTGSFIGWNRKR